MIWWSIFIYGIICLTMSVSATAAAPIPLNSLAWNSPSNTTNSTHSQMATCLGIPILCVTDSALDLPHERSHSTTTTLTYQGWVVSTNRWPQMSCHVVCASRERTRWDGRKGLLEPCDSHGGFASFQLLACTGNCLYEQIGREDWTRASSHQSLFLCLFLLLSSSFLSGVYRIWGLQQAAISPCSLRRDFSAADHSSHLGLYMHMLC